MAGTGVGVATSLGTYRPRTRTGQTAVHATQAVLMIMTRAVIPRPTTPHPLQGIDEGIHEMIVHQTGQVTFLQEVKEAIMSVITETPHPELGVTPGASAEVVGGVIPATSIMVGKITITNVGIKGVIASKNRDMVQRKLLHR